MKRSFLLALLVLGAPHLFGAGLIIIHDEGFWHDWPPRPGPRPPHERRIMPPPHRPVYAPIEVSHTKADVTIKDQVATTKVEQEFYNPNPRQLEGTFLFPVPKGAHIDKFAMTINGKPVEAELLNAEKARGIYEEIVRRQKDPALLEHAGRDLFKVRIFPIEPHERKKINLSYSQVLKADAGLISFVLPLNTEKFSAKPVRSMSLRANIESKRALKSIYSPSHKVEVKRDGAHKATVGFEANDVKPDADFQLFYTVDESDLGVHLLTHKVAGEDGYFLLLASPGAEVKHTKIIPKDIVFVLDTSGSMAGAKLEQAKKALAFCVENLNDDDRFEILRFATEVEPLFNGFSEASKENRSRAQKFITDLKPIGGTAINDALKKAVALRPERGSRPFVVVFLTDGRPTVGDTDENHIVENATKSKTGLTRIFCFGIGTDVNTHLLDRVAEETKAFSQYVLADEDLEVKVSSFFTKIKEPVLSNPKLTFPGDVRVSKLYPSPVPDIFKGEQLILAGRYSGSGSGALQIEGDVAGDTKKFAYDLKFAREESENEFIPRLWATRRVGYLLDEIRLHGENKELKDEVTELARKYGIVTPYTAYLIIEDERRREVPLSMQTLPELRQLDRVNGIAPADSYARVWERSKLQKDGDGAVADARSFYALKSAEAPGQAIASGNLEALRAGGAAGPDVVALGAESQVAQMRRLQSTPRGTTLSVQPAPAAAAASVTAMAEQLERRGKFVAGRTFFLNADKWIDSEVQKKKDAKRVRVVFGSEDYFELLNDKPEARPWLALGRNVEFTLGDSIYEVVEQ